MTEASAGGAEQVLWGLERELHSLGHETWVAASTGSQVSGRLVSTGEAAAEPEQLPQREQEMRDTVAALLSTESFDCVHDMSGMWWRYSAEVEEPVLATLHLPRSFYPSGTFDLCPENVFFNCVSRTEMITFGELPRMLDPVPNGIALDRFMAEPPLPRERRKYLLWLGRICEEKGPHYALDVAFAAEEKMILAGTVYPFLYHQKFYAREVLPRIRRSRQSAKVVSEPSFGEKLSLLRNAKALMITSTAPETSSMVAMEAAACGTPVIALDSGAIREVMRESVTGWIGSDLEHLRSLLPLISEINPDDCVRHAEQHYSAATMARRYEECYRRLLRAEPKPVSLNA